MSVALWWFSYTVTRRFKNLNTQKIEKPEYYQLEIPLDLKNLTYRVTERQFHTDYFLLVN